jgi:DNA polymerase IIIc chi subunit
MAGSDGETGEGEVAIHLSRTNKNPDNQSHQGLINLKKPKANS